MATQINVSSLTINPEEARLVSEIVAPLVYSNPDFIKYHNVISGIANGQQIVLDNGGGDAGILDANCTAVESGSMAITLSQLFWAPKTIGDQMIHCQADLDQNFKMAVKKFAADHKNIDSSNELLTYIIARLERYIKESMERLIWLGDTAAADNTGGGYVKDTVNELLYKPLDGIWKQAFAAVGAGTTPRFTVTPNAQVTKALQLSTMTPALAFAAIEGVYINASDLLKSDPTAYITVTPSIYHNYKQYLMDTPLSAGGLSQALVDGVTVVKYAGVPVYNSLFIGNKILEAFQVSQGGTPETFNYNLPHRVLMTTPENVPVGTLSEDDFSKVESFYYQKDRVNYFRFAYDLDVKVLRPQLMSVGY